MFLLKHRANFKQANFYLLKAYLIMVYFVDPLMG